MATSAAGALALARDMESNAGPEVRGRWDAAIAEVLALEAVAAAAQAPDCNFWDAQECGWQGTTYVHGEAHCPRGRLNAALRFLDDLRRGR